MCQGLNPDITLNMIKSSFGKGVLCAVFAYLVWGFLPLYWRMLAQLNSMHILAFRILFSLLLISIILFIQKKTSWLVFYKDRHKCIRLIFSGITICFSWGFYIWAVNGGFTIESALGYYINPLISIMLGMVIFKEKLNFLQGFAFALALAGVLLLTIFTGSLPWISILIGLSFTCYSFMKKTINMPALESVGVETLIGSPLGIILLFTPLGIIMTAGDPGHANISYLAGLPPLTLFLLIFIGAATTLPLFLFSIGARLLPLSTLGFIQFISPTMTFLTGFFIFKEPFPPRNFIVFGFIWAAAILYIISLRMRDKKT